MPLPLIFPPPPLPPAQREEEHHAKDDLSRQDLQKRLPLLPRAQGEKHENWSREDQERPVDPRNGLHVVVTTTIRVFPSFQTFEERLHPGLIVARSGNRTRRRDGPEGTATPQHTTFRAIKSSSAKRRGAGRYEVMGQDRGFCMQTRGFNHIHVTDEKMTVQFINPDGQRIHAYERDLSGKTTVLKA